MSQIFILPGAEASGDIFETNEHINVYDMRTMFNAALEAVNGSLTDANLRPREGTYDGIDEAKIVWADSDGVGHNHDGVNSAPLGPGSVISNILADDLKYLRHSDSVNPVATALPFVACGRIQLKYEDSTVGGVTLSGHGGFAYDPNTLSINAGTSRVVATLVYLKGAGATVSFPLMHQPSPEVAFVSATPGAVRINFQWRITGPIVPADGELGANWVFTALTTRTDPTT